jgi:hypothetical protein
MSFSRVGLGLFKGVGGGITGLGGAAIVTFAARYISYLSPVSVTETAFILALGNFLYGLAVSDANGHDKIQKAAGIGNFATSVANANMTRFGNAMFYADNGNIDKALDSFKGGEIREKFFIQDFLYSIFENVTAGTIGFGALMLLNPSNISYLQLMDGVVAGTLVASTARSVFY